MFDNLRDNFEVILISLFVISAVAYTIYRLSFFKYVKADFLANQSELKHLPGKARKKLKHNILSTHLNSFYKKTIFFFADLFWVLLFVIVLRSFLFEPFIIPSGSMKPGLQIGDIVLVNKFAKGLRIPITNQRLTQGEAIKRGDVLVFKYPGNPKISYIKRVIGLPGDKIYYDNRRMIINGKPISLKPVTNIIDKVKGETAEGEIEKMMEFTIFQEDLLGVKNNIRYAKGYQAPFPEREWFVPKGKYLMLGDNRDNSADGRAFGFLDDSMIIGRAKYIVLNFDCFKLQGKCNRFFKTIN